MTRTHATRRPGLSILEVMVALFVAALGMLSLLSLFPLGAVQMGQALRDARAAETVAQADTHMRLWWQKYVVEKGVRGITNPAPGPSYPDSEDSAFTFLDNPQNAALPVLSPVDGNPSYPVAIDPLGWQARNGLLVRQTQVAGGAGGLVPRRSMFWITNDPTSPQAGTPSPGYPPPTYPFRPVAFQVGMSFRVPTLMDDITFNEFGAPDTNASGTGVANLVVRQGRYNWLAVIQRPVNSNRHVADLKIAVFDGRAPGIAPTDAEQVFNPTGTITAGTSQLVLAGDADYLKAGSWIMDGTLTNTGVRNAIWYRIQAIDRDVLPGNMILDLQTPLLRDVSNGSLIYTFKGLLEVFDRPQLAPPGYKKQSP